jgi:hypothetical protein
MDDLPIELFSLILNEAGEAALYVSILVSHSWHRESLARLKVRAYSKGMLTCFDGSGTITYRIFRAACYEGLEELAIWSDTGTYTTNTACEAIGHGHHALVEKIFPLGIYTHIDHSHETDPEFPEFGPEDQMDNMYIAAGRSGNPSTIAWALKTFVDEEEELELIKGLVQGGHIPLLNYLFKMEQVNPIFTSKLKYCQSLTPLNFDIFDYEPEVLRNIIFNFAGPNPVV